MSHCRDCLVPLDADNVWEEGTCIDCAEQLGPVLLAMGIAESAHAGQVDKVGQPYIEHPQRVAAAVFTATHSREAEAVAWLHDVVEGTAITVDDLRRRFPDSIVAAVDAMTKRKGEAFAAYYERVKANPLATVVKWHVVADNADPARLAKVAPDTRDRLRAKYERARALLAAAQEAT